MADIVFPPTTAPGQTPAESGGRLINAYAEALIGQPGSSYVIRRTSGLRMFTDTLQSTWRSSFFDGTTLFSAWSGQLVKTTSLGVSSIITGLGGTDWITWAKNQRTPTPDMVLVSVASGPFTFDATGKAVWADPPSAPNSVCFGEGYFFITIADGRVYASGLNATTINTLDRIQAQSRANNGLVRAVWFGGELWIFSDQHCEVWGSGGNPNATGFPLRRNTVIPRGLAARSCITGWEDTFGGRLCFLADDNTIRAFNGYDPEVISDPWLTTVLERIADKSTLQMGCFIRRGHQCIYIRGPSFCACYDFSTKWWHERMSYLSPTWRWQGGSSFAFGDWLSGDATSGQMCAVDFDVFEECGDPLVWTVESGPVMNFPARQQVARAAFQFQQGTGLADAGGALASDVDPMLEISWTDDNGASWSNPLQRPLGRLGEYRNLIDPRMLGMTGYVGRRWRLRTGARVRMALLGGMSLMQERA